jgi:lipoate-protein ligase B
MLYEVDRVLLDSKPEIRIGDRVFAVDDRMSTFVKMNGLLTEAKTELSEFDIIIGCGISAEALAAIKEMDLSFAAMHRVVVLIMAAMQGVSEEEARKRFQSNAG